MGCTDLDNAMGEAAAEITATAVNRGKIDKFSMPLWAPGTAKAVSAIMNHQSARIERLQKQEQAIYQVREQRCK